jgi:uncharacterized peroxidase-related enzyme
LASGYAEDSIMASTAEDFETPNSLRDICGLDLVEKNDLDDEMATFVHGIEKKYGFVPNFLRLWASDNKRLRAFLVPWLELMRTDSGLSPLDHELIALVCANENGCAYCCAHHGATLRGVSGDPVFAELIGRNYKLAELSSRDRAMLDFVVMVEKEPEAIGDTERDRLRAEGFDDEAIWYIASTAAFYASANRMSAAVGLKITPEYLTMHR